MKAFPFKAKLLRRSSLLRRLTVFLVLIYLILFSLMLFNDFYAIHSARAEIGRGLADSLQLYCARIDTRLSGIEAYLAGMAITASSADLRVLEQTEMDTTYYTTLEKKRSEMSSTLYSSELVEGFFVYPTTNRAFIYSSKSPTSASTAALRRITRDSQTTGALATLPALRWFPIYANGEYYLVRYFRHGNSYVGAWVNFSALLAETESDLRLVEQLLVSMEVSGIFNSRSEKIASYSSVEGYEDGYVRLRFNGETYLAISMPVEKLANGNIVAIVSDEALRDSLMQNYFAMVVAGICFILPFSAIIYAFRRSIRRPISALEKSITTLREQDFSVRLDAENEYEEFARVNTAFNDMVARIRDLKISVYEEQLLQKETEMKHLKNQLAPHFLINCLNAMYHLAGADQTALIQKMAITLSRHLRYALSGRSIVPLEEELSLVQNYIELSALRFPGGITSAFTIDPKTRSAQTLAMSLVNFAENTVKYSVVSGRLVTLHVETELLPTEAEPRVLLRVWDTGNGWSEEMLAYLNSAKLFESEDGARIGLKNTAMRGRLLWGEAFSLRFSNHPDGGAQIEMEYPMQPNASAIEKQEGES